MPMYADKYGFQERDITLMLDDGSIAPELQPTRVNIVRITVVLDNILVHVNSHSCARSRDWLKGCSLVMTWSSSVSFVWAICHPIRC